MPAEKQNVTHRAGRRRTLKFGPVLDEKGRFVDLSTSTARWRLAKAATSTGADIYVTKDSQASGDEIAIDEDQYVTSELHYIVRVELTHADTVDVPPCVPPNKYWHECEVIDANGQPFTIASGEFDLQPSVMNDPAGGGMGA